MRLILPLITIFCASQLALKAETPVTPVMPYGKIDKADLSLTNCEFEKDANAMVLFEKGDLYYDQSFNIIIEVHKRIKIFNDNGKDAANIKINYDGGNHFEYITGLQAETINLVNDKIEMTKVDSKQIFNQIIDKVEDQMVFSFPNVKAGCVIEFKYRRTIASYSYIPEWTFQGELPTRYSEFDVKIPEYFYFKKQTHLFQPMAKNKSFTSSSTLGSTTVNEDVNEYALANVKSLPDEAYMVSKYDNSQRVSFQLTSIKPINGIVNSFNDTWPKVATTIAEDEDFGSQIKRRLTNEEAILAEAKKLKTSNEKIAYIFTQVKNTLKWNGVDRWYTIDGTRTAWDKKTGNSTEINLILYRLLKQAGVVAYPMVVSTRNNGRVSPYNPSIRQFNRAVVYIPIDSTTHYVMDATNKYNLYNEIPDNLLNNYGFVVDKEKYETVFLEKHTPSRKVIMITADILPDGSMNGNAAIGNYSYNRINALKAYNALGEKKFIEALSEHNNNLKISSLKLENAAIDSLPLNQNVQFKLDLTGSDNNYIYFNCNLFLALHDNPFLSDKRITDIDFGYLSSVFLNGSYKLPQGYKTDAIPKNIILNMPDKSIMFKRMVVEEDGVLTVRYNLVYNKSQYLIDDYPALHEFYKKMHEMLNEQVVLKKS